MFGEFNCRIHLVRHFVRFIFPGSIFVTFPLSQTMIGVPVCLARSITFRAACLERRKGNAAKMSDTEKTLAVQSKGVLPSGLHSRL